MHNTPHIHMKRLLLRNTLLVQQGMMFPSPHVMHLTDPTCPCSLSPFHQLTCDLLHSSSVCFCGALQLGGHTGWCRRCTGCAQWCMPDSMTERRNCRIPWKHIGSKSFRHTLRSLQAFHNVHHINKLIAHDRHTTTHRWRMDVLPT